jgi:hypothetical protein
MMIELQTPDPRGPQLPRDIIVPAELHEVIAFHVIAVHRNISALESTPLENLQFHLDEHFGCGGLGNHDWRYFSFDETSLEQVLEEAEELDYSFTRGKLPNGLATELHWSISSAARNFLTIGGH